MVHDPDVDALVAFISKQAPPTGSDPRLRSETLRRLLALSAELVVGVDGEGRIAFRNANARALFAREILGLPARDALSYGALEALCGGQPPAEERVIPGPERRALLWRGLALGEGALPALLIGRDVTEVHRATTSLGNRVKRLEAMHAISLALGQGLAPHLLYAMAFARLAEVVPLSFGALYRLSGDRGEPAEVRLVGVVAWDDGEERVLDETLALASHPAKLAVAGRATTRLSTGGSDALPWPQLQLLERRGVRQVAAVPLLEEARTLGVLWLGTASPSGFSAEDLDAAQELAGLLVNAMQRQRLQDRIAGYTRELEARVAARTSELASTREQLLATARLSSIGELSAGVAHELNQPLNIITGYLELLQDDDLSPEEATKAIEVMSRAAERMAVLVRHLRDFSRSGVETLRGVDLRQVLDMARDLTARATRRPITVRWERPADAVTVLGDPGRLEQLFINLLANAMQATETNGGEQVSVTVRFVNEELWVEIADQGTGVPAHLRSHIFEPFFTTKERGKGTGLGLSISAKIAAEHQGRVEVDDAPGGGAVFRVVLPSYRVG